MPKPDHRSQMARAWLHFHAARKGRGSGSAAPRVDWPVYPRRAEHNTVAEGGNRRSTIAASSQIRRSPFSLASFSYPTDPSGSVRAIASNASTVMAMLIKRQARRASDLLQPAFFVFAPQRSPENRWATSVSHVGQTTQWSSSGTGSNMLIAIVLGSPIGRPGIIPRALGLSGRLSRAIQWRGST
jgi:hypothetical protein